MMRALVLDADGPRVAERPVPVAGDGEALIRIERAGVCSTDLELVKGYAGFAGILGHEFVGVVEQAEETRWHGRRVVGSINIACRRCSECIGRGPEHCPHRTVLGIIGHDGIFADYAVLPIANLLAVPDEVCDDQAVFTEPLAAALRIRQQLTLSPTAHTAVVGPGRLGLLIAQVMALAGSRPRVLGRSRRSLELATDLGLDTGLVDDAEDDAFDVVVEATGNSDGLAHALRMTRPLGTLVMKSTYAGQAQVDLTKVVVGELTLVGSRCGPFAPALSLLASGAVSVEPLIDGRYPLDEALTALEHAARPGVRKILLDIAS